MASIQVGVGTTFRYAYADSFPMWRVVKPRGDDTWDCVIVGQEYAGTKKVFGGEEIRPAIELDRLAQRNRDEHACWWAERRSGEIVHYHYGFGQYVRGVIVEHDGQHQMRATGLVGDWKDYDLRTDSHYLRKIRDGAPFQPNVGNMFENPEFSRRGRDPDPRTASVVAGMKIVTNFVYPPIPERSMDWEAHLDGYEPGEPVGHGATEADAVAELFAQLAERGA
jgi:hypothetical protein